MIDKNIYLPGWFEQPGAWVLVDGQFGSTGKGLMAGWLAEYGVDKITHVTTNQGPNSGHTAYWNPRPDYATALELADKIMTQQLPVASVFMRRQQRQPLTLLNAGAVIDDKILDAECKKYGFNASNLLIHPNAAMITEDNKTLDKITVGAIAGTGKGVGPAIAAKALRHGDQLAYSTYRPMLPAGFRTDRGWDNFWDWGSDVVFVETAQGFSLGVNSSRFYPNVTSRECTVAQACADARIPVQMVKGVIACFPHLPHPGRRHRELQRRLLRRPDGNDLGGDRPDARAYHGHQAGAPGLHLEPHPVPGGGRREPARRDLPKLLQLHVGQYARRAGRQHHRGLRRHSRAGALADHHRGFQCVRSRCTTTSVKPATMKNPFFVRGVVMLSTVLQLHPHGLRLRRLCRQKKGRR
jgi:hypothetical protein